MFIDPDGRDFILTIDFEKNTITISGNYYVQKGDEKSRKSAESSCDYWNNQSGKFKFEGGDDDKTAPTVNFELNVFEVDDPNNSAERDAGGNTYTVLSDKEYEDKHPDNSAGITTADS